MRVRGAFVQGLVDRLPDSQSFFSEFCLLFRCKILCGTSSDQWAGKFAYRENRKRQKNSVLLPLKLLLLCGLSNNETDKYFGAVR